MLDKLSWYVAKGYEPTLVWPLYRGYMSYDAFGRLWNSAMDKFHGIEKE